ncbi:MAG: hypothetical protein AAFO07_14385, partial [Bacteroidota bacterium]
MIKNQITRKLLGKNVLPGVGKRIFLFLVLLSIVPASLLAQSDKYCTLESGGSTLVSIDTIFEDPDPNTNLIRILGST